MLLAIPIIRLRAGSNLSDLLALGLIYRFEIAISMPRPRPRPRPRVLANRAKRISP